MRVALRNTIDSNTVAVSPREGRSPAAPPPENVTRCLALVGAKALADAVNRYLAAGIPAVPPAYPVSGADPPAAGGLRRQDDPRRARQ